MEKAIESIIDSRRTTPKKIDFEFLITAKMVKNDRIFEPDEFISPEDYET